MQIVAVELDSDLGEVLGRRSADSGISVTADIQALVIMGLWAEGKPGTRRIWP
jgi:hypothetical protein